MPKPQPHRAVQGWSSGDLHTCSTPTPTHPMCFCNVHLKDSKLFPGKAWLQLRRGKCVDKWPQELIQLCGVEQGVRSSLRPKKETMGSLSRSDEDWGVRNEPAGDFSPRWRKLVCAHGAFCTLVAQDTEKARLSSLLVTWGSAAQA